MRSDKTKDLFAYWNRLRNGRRAPKRTEVEPADIKTLLANTFILEKDTVGRAIFRLAGTRICAFFGRELKGFNINSFWPAKEAKLVGKLIDDTFASGQVVLIGFEGVSRNDRVAQFEMIVMTLDGGKDNPRAMGSINAINPVFWLGADPICEAHITSIRIIDPDREPLYLKNRPDIMVPTLEPKQRQIASLADIEEETGKRVRHLMVIPGGKQEPAKN